MEKQPNRQPGSSKAPTGVEPDAETLQAGHEESLAATRELAQQVESAEAAEGGPTPSQADADETAATGI